MIISDLSYLEVAEEAIEGSGNSAYVSQYAYSAAGNNSGGYNASLGNTAISINTSSINQYNTKYGYGYYFPW